MLAMTRDMMVPAGGLIDLRLSRLRLPPAWQPGLTRLLRLAMGFAVGAVLGAAAGHAGFWLATGATLGAALDAIIRRS